MVNEGGEQECYRLNRINKVLFNFIKYNGTDKYEKNCYQCRIPKIIPVKGALAQKAISKSFDNGGHWVGAN